MGPAEVASKLYCTPRSDADSRFKDAHFELCKAHGRGRSLRNDCTPGRPYEAAPGVRTFTGVDIGVGKKRPNARTVFFTAARWPDAQQLIPSAPAGQVANEVLNIRSGKYHGEEIVRIGLEEQQRFGSQLIVEAVAAQRFIARFLHLLGGGRHVPVIAFNTGKNKHHPQFGVEGLAVGFALGLWCIPCAEDGSVHPEVAAWIEDMRFYDPNAHTGDYLMASWMAAEGAAGRAQRYAVAIAEEDPSGRLALQERAAHVQALERVVLPPSSLQVAAAERARLRRQASARGLWQGLDELLDLGVDLGDE